VVLARGFEVVVDLSLVSTALDGDVWKNQNFDPTLWRRDSLRRCESFMGPENQYTY
jgi:hypothetical protein